MKTCTKCNKSKDLKEFYKTTTTKDGYTYNCIACYQKYREEHKESAKSYMKRLRDANRISINEKKRLSWQKLDPRRKMLSQAKSRARTKNIEFNLNVEDIILPDECPLLNLPFVVGTKEDYEQTYSLDRINPNKGYIKENVCWISGRANRIKYNATIKELEQILTYMKGATTIPNGSTL